MIRFGVENIFRDPVTAAAIVGTGFSVGGSIYSGVQTNNSARREAKYIQQQGQIALEQSKKDAEIEAFNQRQAIGNQRLAFLANGVSLEGSPMLITQQSEKFGQQSVDAILAQGANQADLANHKAKIMKSEGRAALIGGILQGTSSALTGGAQMKKAGMFDPTTSTGKSSYTPARQDF